MCVPWFPHLAHPLSWLIHCTSLPLPYQNRSFSAAPLHKVSSGGLHWIFDKQLRAIVTRVSAPFLSVACIQEKEPTILCCLFRFRSSLANNFRHLVDLLKQTFCQHTNVYAYTSVFSTSSSEMLIIFMEVVSWLNV